MKIGIVNISDIHFGLGAPENEGVVLSAFVNDIQEQMDKNKYDDLFVFIGGDLINIADDNNYDRFDAEVIKPIIEKIKINRNHIIVSPGNHDVQQSKVKDCAEMFIPVVEKKYPETEFNDLIHKEATKSMLLGKFGNFEKYVKENLIQPDYNLLGYGCDLNESWAVYCLNTSILSAGAYKGRDDRGYLSVNTRDLHLWAKDNVGKNKILLMHHPFEMMTDWSASELKKIIRNNFDLVLSGHMHEQDLICNNLLKEKFIYCQAPQLFTNKTETSGYCIIVIDNRTVERVIYREWNNKKQRFRVGLSFTEEDNGIVEFSSKDNNLAKTEDIVSVLLHAKLSEAMRIYNDQPIKWLDRYVSSKRLDRVTSLKNIDMVSESDIIEKRKSLKILATPQFGLTCFAYHFLITLWEQYSEFGLFIEGSRLSGKRVDSLVNGLLIEFNKSQKDVKWIVIDNWHLPKKDSKVVWEFFKNEYLDIPILLTCSVSEIYFNQTEEFIDDLARIPIYYLTPLKYEQERQIVETYNKNNCIADNESVLKRLDKDIRDFNLPKSPFSCSTLLSVFAENFDENLINRTDVLHKFLYVVFDNTRIPTYKSEFPDLQDCEYCLGYFCSTIIDKSDLYYFKREYFTRTVNDICTSKSLTLDPQLLFDILLKSRIITEFDGFYCFRFSFWVYYFSAIWMLNDEKFAQKILNNQSYMHYPDIMECYSGIDRKRENAAIVVEQDLKHIIDCVKSNAGVDDKLNPFAVLKYNPSDEVSERILDELDKNVEHSNLPQRVKDSLVDNAYNPSITFYQDIDKVYEDFSVGHLIRSIEIASKVLRNSDYINRDIKVCLLSTIASAWKLLSTIIYLVSKLFSKQKYIQLPGYGFKLGDGFSDDEDKRTIQIIVSIPKNMMILFKDCIYSYKLSDMFVSSMLSEPDKVKKHLEACLLIYKQPLGWDNAIKEYITKINKDSYYIGTMIELMQDVLYIDDIDNRDRSRMATMARTAIFKSKSPQGLMPNSLQDINRIPLSKPKAKDHFQDDNDEDSDKENLDE